MTAPSPPERRPRPYLADALAVLCLLVLALKLTCDISRVRDIDVGDDAIYMEHGVRMAEQGLPPAAGGPLYSLWYYALSHWQPDRIALYYLSWSLLTFLVPLSLYVLCRVTGGSRTVALLAAFLLLTSTLPAVSPYPAHLAAVILALGTALAVSLRRLEWCGAVLGLTLLVASFIRPEYGISFALFCPVALGAAAWITFRRPGRLGSLAAAVLLVVVGVGTLLGSIGNPLASNRSFVAFGQHYAVNVVKSRQLRINPWVHWEALARADFGQAESVGAACRANPYAFLWHVSVNCRRLPAQLLATAAPDLELSPRGTLLLGVLLALVAAGGAVGLVYRLSRRETDGRLMRVVVMLALMLAPVAASAVVIMPRSHYLVPAVVFAFALAASGLDHLPWYQRMGDRLDSWPILLVLGGVLFSLTPNRAHGWDVQDLVRGRQAGPMPSLCEQKTVAALRELKLSGPTVLLDCIGPNRAFYAGLSLRWVSITAKEDSFWTFVRRNDINVIVLDANLARDPRCREDPEFQGLLSGSRPEDFQEVGVAGTPVRILVRQDTLPLRARAEP